MKRKLMASSSTSSCRLLSAALLFFFVFFWPGAHGQTCLEDPSQSECMSYTYPDANSTADMAALCGSMDIMPGCTIRTLCQDATYASDEYCEPFSVLADVCEYDMPGMSGCKNYVSLCGPADSVVHQCDIFPSIPGLPTTMYANDAIKSMCSQHAMPGCEKCVDNGGIMSCDLLSVYSEICLSMPSMADCAQWHLMCESIPDWGALCPSTTVEQPPIMKMYFHTGFVDYILFESWVPRSAGEYAGAVIGVMALAFFFEGFQTFRAYMDFRWNQDDENSDLQEPLNAQKPRLVWGQRPFRFWIDLQRSALHVVEIFLGYCLMLIAMTFNVGLFLSILAGFFLGSFTFGRYRAYKANPSCCD